MAESGLFMECEEEELEPCQQVNDDVEVEDVDMEESGMSIAPSHLPVVPPTDNLLDSSAYVSATEMSFSSQGINPVVTLFPPSTIPVSLPSSIVAPPIAPQLVSSGVPQVSSGPRLVLTRSLGGLGPLTVSQILQPLQVVPREQSTTRQPCVITAPGLAVQTVRPGLNPINPVGFLLNGQPITLVPAPGAQFIKPVAGTHQVPSQPETLASGPFTAIPISTSTARHEPTPLTQLPLATTGTQMVSLPALPKNTGPNEGSVIVMKQENSCNAQTIQKVVNAISASAEAVASNGGASADSLSAISNHKAGLARTTPDKKVCPRCGAQFRVVEILRGRMCHCCPELRQDLQATDAPSSVAKRPESVAVSVPALSLPLDTGPEATARSSSSEQVVSGSVVSEGKLVMLVDDFYYGSDTGLGLSIKPPAKAKTGTENWEFACFTCHRIFKNNIRMMNHMKLHSALEHQSGEMDTHTICQHCFRRFMTPFQLQCHIENIHSNYESSIKCKICDWAFESEPVFLRHMKNNHKPGEMPYLCQVCLYRSSFYSDVHNHFCTQHKTSCYLLCPYCFRVFTNSKHYQNHYFQHQKKKVYCCDRCRLQFLCLKEKANHQLNHHKTFRKPKQLEGLEPGTKVTVRTYAVELRDGRPSGTRAPQAENVLVQSGATSADVKHVVSKKMASISLAGVMTKFQEQRTALGIQNCMECSYVVGDFTSHFPTYVSCSKCRYKTCCSRAYANHMINNHVDRKTTTKYLTLFKEDSRLAVLTCSFCAFETEVGDQMAKHQVTQPGHGSSFCSFKDSSRDGFTQNSLRSPSSSNVSDGNQQPLTGQHLHGELQVVQEPTQLKSPVSTAPSCTLPAPAETSQGSLTDANVDEEMAPVEDTNWDAEQKMACGPQENGEGVLTVHQLRILLLALCCGVSKAAERFKTHQPLIWNWLRTRRRRLIRHGRHQNQEVVDQIMKWVLTRREQQLPIDEKTFFQVAKKVSKGVFQISYDWAVDFFLLNELGLQTVGTVDHPLFQEAEWRAGYYIKSIHMQIKSKNFPLSDIGCMDELSIYMDCDMLTSPSSATQRSAFQLVGTGVPMFDVVLALLADGTVLPAMLFFSGQGSVRLPADLPQSVLLLSKLGAFSQDQILRLWFDKVWRKHVDDQDGANGMLIIDAFRGHRQAKFVSMLEKVATLPAIIPAGCSCRFHPLETCVTPVLRDFLQTRWGQAVARGGVAGAKAKDLVQLLVGWLAEAMARLAGLSKLLQQSFHVAGVFPKHRAAPKLELQKEIVRTLQEVLHLDRNSIDDDEIECNQDTNVDCDSSEENVARPSLYLSPPARNPLALRQVFEKDSDGESSFVGFEEAEMNVC